MLALDSFLAISCEFSSIEHRSLEVPGRCWEDTVLVNYPANPCLCLARLADPLASVSLEGECRIQPDAEPPGGVRSEVHYLFPDSNASLAVSMFSLPGEDDGPYLGCLKPNSVALCSLLAGFCASLELTGHVIKVGPLHNPGDIVDEGDASAILDLALNCLWISAIYRAKSTGDTGDP